MKDSNTNKSKQLEELYIKLDKVDKRMFRLVVRLHIQFLSEMVLCIALAKKYRKQRIYNETWYGWASERRKEYPF